jgi:hypothetical protein
MWCGRLRAAVTVAVCQARHLARRHSHAPGTTPQIVYRDCAGCPEGEALRERLAGVAPVVLARRPALYLVPRAPTEDAAPDRPQVSWFGEDDPPEETTMMPDGSATAEAQDETTEGAAAVCAVPACGEPCGQPRATTPKALRCLCRTHRGRGQGAIRTGRTTLVRVVAYLSEGPHPTGRKRGTPPSARRPAKAPRAPRETAPRTATRATRAPESAYSAALDRVRRLNACAARCGGLDALEALLDAVLAEDPR